MAADMSAGGPELPGWMVTVASAVIAACGGFFVALINRSPALQAAVDSRLHTLIDGYESRVDDLTLEVNHLREEVIALRKALSEATSRSTGFGM
jgi:hypothetical protein